LGEMLKGGDKVIKILYRQDKDDIWLGTCREPAYFYKEETTLKYLLTELIDKDNWTIIVATTEYIILQKEIEEDPQERRERLEKEKIKILSTPM